MLRTSSVSVLVVCSLAALASVRVPSVSAAPPVEQDARAFPRRGDIRHLPTPLKQRLTDLANRPHSYLPLRIFAEAPSPSALFEYYLLDTTGFEPNVFTTT